MRTLLFLPVACALSAGPACGGAQDAPKAPASNPESAALSGLAIRHTSILVDDQEKAVTFYTEVLGFAKKDDFSNEGYRWVTVHAPSDPNGTELQLALDNEPAANAYQESLYKSQKPALMLYARDVKAEHERLAAKGAKVAMPVTEVMPGVVISQIDDGCGNLIQLTQLDR